ncbi:MAG: aldolase catalytic domain-containing protein [Desulfosporosinus sp.]
MNRVRVLDCTLRDGGYINNWEFGKENIRKIISKLVEANIDIVECGFMTEKRQYNVECSQFDSVGNLVELLPDDCQNAMTVCMINYGEYDINNLTEHDGTSIDGLRVAFHKKDMEAALQFCRGITEKRYKLFMQPMVSLSYTDVEFLSLIKAANEIKPYAFYIVDSFGVMKRNDMLRLYYMVDHNLDKDIYVGYHSHNNIQLSYSNAQALADLKTKRKLIIDSSVFGMGRGAGNLNTELFIEYLNDSNGGDYKAKPLLQIIDQVLGPVYITNYWGYSLPHYVSAIHNCHPNYASFLDDKSTLTVENINDILGGMDPNKKNNFDKVYIEELYNEYQANKITDSYAREELAKVFNNKTVVMIAPGSSINSEADKIYKAISEPDTITICVNFKSDTFDCDYVFVSNLRRYDDMKYKDKLKLIVTSNIKDDCKSCYIVNYSKLLNDVEAVMDNAGMMLINLLIELGVKRIKIAGLDGYSHDVYKNFAERDMAFMKRSTVMDAMNAGMEKMLREFSKQVQIEFVTDQKFVRLGDA